MKKIPSSKGTERERLKREESSLGRRRIYIPMGTTNRLMIMTVKQIYSLHGSRNIDSKKEDNHNIDAEVDLEVELICALNEIEIPTNKKRIQKDTLKKYIQ